MTLNKSQNDLIETQNNLIKAERMGALAELAMGTVHQINNPLSIVMGRVQMLQRLLIYKASIPMPDLDRDLKVIEEQTGRAVQITNSLLRYAAPVTFRFERCAINELLKDTIGLIQKQLEEEKIAAEKAAEELEIALLSQKGLVSSYFLDKNFNWLSVLEEKRLEVHGEISEAVRKALPVQ